MLLIARNKNYSKNSKISKKDINKMVLFKTLK